MPSSDYAMQATKGIKKSFDNAVQTKLESYKDSRIFTFETTSEFDEIFTSTEGLSGSRELGELETPPTLKLEDGYSVTLSDKRFGGAIELSEKMQVQGRDDTTKIDKYLKRQRNQLLKDNVNLFLSNSFLMLNDAFTGTYYLAPDGLALCHDAHLWKSGGTFDNKSTAVLTSGAVDDVQEYGGAFTDPSGKPMPISFDTIVVKKGSPNSVIAKKLFAENIKPTAVNDINIYEGTYTIIETPYITAANKANWFMFSSMLENPLYVGINVMPGLNEPIRQNNEAIRTNVTGFYKVGINNMPFNFYGSTGAGS